MLRTFGYIMLLIAGGILAGVLLERALLEP